MIKKSIFFLLFLLISLFASSPFESVCNAKEVLTNSLGMKFVLINSGSFQMGSPEHEEGHKWNEVQHKVTISKAFYILESEVTQGQWGKLVRQNPSAKEYIGKNYPVNNVSWNQCIKFIEFMNTYEKTDKYRLPTEAEWEFACRAGTVTAFSSGPISKNSCSKIDPALNITAWYCANSGVQNPPGDFRPHPVKTKSPNAWGIYDMHGNIQEWVQDSCKWKHWWTGRMGPVTDTYKNNIVDPVSKTGEHKIIRGGGWHLKPTFCRSAQRSYYRPMAKKNSLGFRIVRER